MIPGPLACGDEENRTPNPRLAKAVLCQLSYVPAAARDTTSVAGSAAGGYVVSDAGPGADAGCEVVTASCHNAASAEAAFLRRLTTNRPTPAAAASSNIFFTWAWEDLNLRPHPYQGCALTN